MVKEVEYRPMSGWPGLLMSIVLLLGGVVIVIASAMQVETKPVFGLGIVAGIIVGIVGIIGFVGLMAIAPNDSRVLLLFGKYKGTVRQSGFFWVNPFFSKTKLSLRVRNFETGSTMTPEIKNAQGQVTQAKTRSTGKPSKVNDRHGNPIEISAVVVWRVVNTFEAMFDVDDFEHFVAVQSEAALRNLASRHPYDSEDHEVSLRGNPVEVCDQLRDDIQERLNTAGVEVIEARISYLAYAPEIAAAMLQRQQAQAVVAARTKIVEGAVGMVRMALDHLAEDKVVELDDERKAQMVSNLLVVLCGDRHAQPVVNAGSLYS